MAKFIDFIEPLNFGGYTLIIPSVSVGNVGQLVADLAITTYKLKKLATIWHPGIMPMVGSDPYNTKTEEPCTACELYGSKVVKVAVIQLRSSIEFKLALNFFKALKEEIVNLNFEEVLIVGSLYAHELHNVELSHFRHVTNTDSTSDKFVKFNVPKVPLEEIGNYKAHGCGFAFKLFELLQSTVKCTIFMKYVSEGDNRTDAVTMQNIISKVLGTYDGKNSPLQIPISWFYVFGNPPPHGIF